MATVTEIAPDVFRICTYVPDFGLQFNQFLVRDEEPLLYHSGMRILFDQVREAVGTVLDPATIRWIAFSHFEADECGALNEWLQVAPHAEGACSWVGSQVSLNDFASRPVRGLEHDEVLETGTHRFRFRHTPHLPHCWEAGMLFEETQGTLFSSDLFHQNGDVPARTEDTVLDGARQTLVDYQAGPFANYMPYTARTEGMLLDLAALQPRTIAAMHGSSYAGDGAQALRDLAGVMREVLGPER